MLPTRECPSGTMSFVRTALGAKFPGILRENSVVKSSLKLANSLVKAEGTVKAEMVISCDSGTKDASWSGLSGSLRLFTSSIVLKLKLKTCFYKCFSWVRPASRFPRVDW